MGYLYAYFWNIPSERRSLLLRNIPCDNRHAIVNPVVTGHQKSGRTPGFFYILGIREMRSLNLKEEPDV